MMARFAPQRQGSHGNRRRWLARVAVPTATTVSILVSFLLYPLTCAYVIRIWVCTPFLVNNETIRFMTDDMLVECRGAAYDEVVAFGIALVTFVVIGMPLMQWLLLRRWAHPFNRLYIPTEDGHVQPSEDGERVLGSLYIMFKPTHYWWSLLDSATKLLLTSFISLPFAESQGTGLIISSMICCVLMSVMMIDGPFVDAGANSLGALTYASLASLYAEAGFKVFALQYDDLQGGSGGDDDGSAQFEPLRWVFENLVLVMYVLPALYGIFAMLRVDTWSKYRRLCRRVARLVRFRAPNEEQSGGGGAAKAAQEFHILAGLDQVCIIVCNHS